MKLKENDRACLCLWCGKLLKVKKNGTVISHQSSGGKCEGSNKRLEVEIKHDKRV